MTGVMARTGSSTAAMTWNNPKATVNRPARRIDRADCQGSRLNAAMRLETLGSLGMLLPYVVSMMADTISTARAKNSGLRPKLWPSERPMMKACAKAVSMPVPSRYQPAVALTCLYGFIRSGNQPFRRKDNGQREQQAKRGHKKHQTVLHDQTLWGQHRHVMPVRQQAETPDRGSSHGRVRAGSGSQSPLRSIISLSPWLS